MSAIQKRKPGTRKSVPGKVKPADSVHKITEKETSEVALDKRPSPSAKVVVVNSLMSSAMRWSGLSVELPVSCMR